MAVGKQQRQHGNIEETADSKKRRTYKSEFAPQVSLQPGDTFDGSLQEVAEITIMDDKRKEEKEVMRYTFRNKDGKRVVILGAVGLDAAFKEMFDAEGGQDRCIGLMVRIERGQNERLSRNRTMGTYAVSCWEE